MGKNSLKVTTLQTYEGWEKIKKIRKYKCAIYCGDRMIKSLQINPVALCPPLLQPSKNHAEENC